MLERFRRFKVEETEADIPAKIELPKSYGGNGLSDPSPIEENAQEADIKKPSFNHLSVYEFLKEIESE